MVRCITARGFSLVELMVAMTLGAIVSVTIIQIMVGNSVTQQLNRALASSQENGRFIIHRLRQDVLHTGLYNELSGKLDRSVDIAEEAIFVRQHPIIMLSTFASWSALGIIDRDSSGSDELVITRQNIRDCRGYRLGYSVDTEFPVVNQYYVEDETLRCRGFDLRVLRGLKVATGHNRHNSIALLQGVVSFQVLYGLGDANTGQVTRYVTASELSDPMRVVVLRMAVLLRSPETINVNNTHDFIILDNSAIQPSGNHIYRQFETTVTLRNARYQVQRGEI